MITRAAWASVFVLFVSVTYAQQDDWSRFRGPNGSGLVNAVTMPVRWTNQDYNWKTDLPGLGHGSPVVWGNRIFLTCGEPETAGRTILCLDTADGDTLWRRDFQSRPHRQHRSNSYATATPAVDALGLVVTWTTPDEVVLLALDLEGNEIWRRDLGPFVGQHGSGSSPIIVDGMVVLANEQGDPQLLARLMGREGETRKAGKSYLIGVNRKTGKTLWQTPRRTTLAPYSTPCIRQRDDGKNELIFTSTSHGITAVDPASGETNWEIDGLFSDRCVGSPVSAAALIIGTHGRGVSGDRCVAVRPGSTAKNQDPSLAYEVTKAVPLVPTPLVSGNRLFLWSDAGIVTSLDVSTGGLIWRERVGGGYFGSPVCVDSRLYCISKKGEVVVLSTSDDFKLLARVELGETSYATPVVAGGVMYLRTASRLYSLGG